MSDQALVAQGGFAPPANTGVSFGLEALRITPLRDLLPAFRFDAGEAHFFVDAAERWAYYRERELQEERVTRMAERQVAAEEWPFEYPTDRREPDW